MTYRVRWDAEEYGSGWPSYEVEDRPASAPPIPDSPGRAGNYSRTFATREEAEGHCAAKNRASNKALRDYLSM